MPGEGLGGSERVAAYIANVRLALEGLGGSSGAAARVVDLARRYVDDAEYYLSRGDVFTALACAAYAEGLLDALRWLGLASLEWRRPSELLERPRVLVAGTFDLLHPGHVALLREAWRLGRVYAVVARDENVERMKGRPPVVPEQQRAETLSAIRYVHRVVLGSRSDMLEPLRRIRPDIVLLGPDQWADEEWLERRLREEGIEARVVRMRERVSCPLCSSTAIACRASEVVTPEMCRARGPSRGPR